MSVNLGGLVLGIRLLLSHRLRKWSGLEGLSLWCGSVLCVRQRYLRPSTKPSSTAAYSSENKKAALAWRALPDLKVAVRLVRHWTNAAGGQKAIDLLHHEQWPDHQELHIVSE